MQTDSRHLAKVIQRGSKSKRGKAIFIDPRPAPHHDRIIIFQIRTEREEIDPEKAKNLRKQGRAPAHRYRRVDRTKEIKRWEFEDPYPRCCEFLGIEVECLSEVEVSR